MSGASLEVIRSNKGHHKVIHIGFMYTKHKAMGNKIRWRCVQRGNHCKGSIFTSTDFQQPRVTVTHNHMPDFDAVEFARSRTMFAERMSLLPAGADESASSVKEEPGYVTGSHDLAGLQASTSSSADDFFLTLPPPARLLRRSVPQTSHGSPAPKPPHQPPQQQPAAPPPQHLPRRPEMKPLAPKPPPRPATPPPPPEVCLRWNSYHSNMQATFPNLLNNEQFVDVTLACEGRSIKCHKVMLSACSSYFDELLTQNPCQHPIVLMKDLRFWEIQALVDFMYCGEVNVGQDKLPSLLAAAEALQIKGLAGPASTPSLADDDEDDDSLPPHVAYDGGGGDHVKRDAVPSPAQSRRARKRRCPAPQPPPPPQVVHHAQPPPSGRSTRLLQRSSTVTSGSAQPSPPPAAAPGPRRSQQQPAAPSEPPARRMRLELSPQKIVETLREIKLEPLDIDDDSVGDCDHLRPSDLADDFADHDGANDDDANNDDTNNGTNDTNSEHGNSSEERPDNHDPGEADATLAASTARRSSPTALPGASGGGGSKLDEDD